MTAKSKSFVYIPGSGGGAPDLSALKTKPDDPITFEIVKYPGWRQCVEPNFSPEKLITRLSMEIVSRVPTGPVRLVGLSLGGHFAYLIALDLQAKGREVESVCAIDSFIISTDRVTSGWQRRAFAELMENVFKFRSSALFRFGRSRFWRAILRAAGGELPRLLNMIARVGWLADAVDSEAVLKNELDLRMLARLVAPWLGTIDNNPVRLSVPVAFMRTGSSASSDDVWRARCSNLKIFEIKGLHHTLFEPENVGSLRDAFIDATGVYKTSNV